MARKRTSAASKGKQPMTTQSPPLHRYNTRLATNAASTVSQGDALIEQDVEELPWYPRYKDDLPNVFNGDIDPSKDYISKIPSEIVDEILSYLVLDHEPGLGVRHKEGNLQSRPHALISMSAMSRFFYQATEDFSHRYLTKYQGTLNYRFAEEIVESYVEAGIIRRSARLSNKPKQRHEVFRKELLEELRIKCAVCHRYAFRAGRFANAVNVCTTCESDVYGEVMVRVRC